MRGALPISRSETVPRQLPISSPSGKSTMSLVVLIGEVAVPKTRPIKTDRKSTRLNSSHARRSSDLTQRNGAETAPNLKPFREKYNVFGGLNWRSSGAENKTN